ncbi:MAG TPA: hypothetical protein VH165_14615 [Kofleriaceae bacterium]|nr:hypothetical protein [Kofleriaceae bacterium]
MACVIGSDGTTGDDGPGTGSGSQTGSGSGSQTGSGTGTTDTATHITANTSWTGTFAVTKQTVIDPGVTVTIPAASTVTLAEGTSVEIKGTLNVMGAKGQEVNISPTTTGGHSYGFTVSAGGALNMTYGIQVGGGIETNGGTTTISDSKLSQAEGDFLVIGAGTVTVSYSTIGVEGTTNSTHCNMHFGGSGTTVHVTHSNIATSSYGLMLYGGNNLDLTYNNWINNTTQIDTAPQASGDISNGWFDKGGTPKAGAGATLTANNISTTRLTDAGPR